VTDNIRELRFVPTRHRTFLLLLFCVVAALLLALTWDLRPYPLSAGVDDSRYVLSAHYLKLLPGKLINASPPLDWLGPYDPTTLVKRPGFSILLAVLSALGLPYLQTVLLLHVIAVGVLARALLRLKYSRVSVAAMFVVGSFFPTLYDANAVRMIREVATGALEVGIMGLCVSLFTVKARRPVGILYSPSFIVLLFLLCLHWSMREEAVLLLPAVIALVSGALWFRDTHGTRHKMVLLLIGALLVVLPSQLVYLCFARLNKASYGVSFVNEISEGNFPRAVNALKRVQESPCDNGLMTADEAQKVLEVSPSFGSVGQTIKAVATQVPNMTYSDAFAIMRISAIQDETISHSPDLTQTLFGRIADEVETACETKRLKCGSHILKGIIPLLCQSQWPLVPSTFMGYLTSHIARLSHSGLSPYSAAVPRLNRLSPAQLESFEDIANQKMAGRDAERVEFSQPASIGVLQRQDYRRSRVSSLYQKVMPWLMAVGVAVLLSRLLFWPDRDRPWSILILAALAAHVLLRVAVFSYFSAVDGYLNSRYISVCYPVAAAFAGLAPAELFRLFRRAGSRDIKLDAKARANPLLTSIAAILALLVASGFVFAGLRTGLPLAEVSPTLLDGQLRGEAGKESMTLNGQSIQILAQPQGWLGGEAGWMLGETAIFDGWCKDAASGRPAKALLIFVDGRLVSQSVPSLAVPSVEAGFPSGAHAGFDARLPRRLLVDRVVRVFALLDGNRAV